LLIRDETINRVISTAFLKQINGEIMIRKTSASILIAAFLCSTTVSAFDLKGLKDLGEKLKKLAPEQPVNNESTTLAQPGSAKNVPNLSAERSSNSGALGFCESEDSVFGLSNYSPMNLSGSPESIVSQYFNIDPALAELQIREQLFAQEIRPIIGVTFPEVITDGGMWSGEARSRGVELMMDPSLTKLAQVIEASKQEPEGWGAIEMQLLESKLVMALVAIQLEPLLKDKALPGRLLKAARQPGKYGGATSVRSRLALAMSARWELVQNNNQQRFDNYIVQSGDSQGGKFSSNSSAGGRSCKLCFDTIDWAANGGIPNWRLASQVEQAKQMRTQLFGNQPPYNPANWEVNMSSLRSQTQELNRNTSASFESAKGQSRSEAKGAEAARISQEGQNTFGGVPDPELDQAISIMRVQTPKYMDAAKRDALAKALKARMTLINDIQSMHMGLMDATFSGQYSYVDIGEKAKSLNDLTRSACLVAFAESRAAAASDVTLPDPSDISEEDSFLRGD